MTHKEKIIATAYTGIMFVDGSDIREVYEYEEGKLGQGVLDIMHESKEFCMKVREAVKDDFIAMLKGEFKEPIVCKCQWKDYYDYRIMLPNGEGHVRLSFFTDEIIISDLYVSEEYRHKYYATILLNKVDELLAGKKAIIYPLEEWQKKWYEQRGYIIGKEDSIGEEKLDEIAKKECPYNDYEETESCIDYEKGFKAGYRKGWEDKQ